MPKAQQHENATSPAAAAIEAGDGNALRRLIESGAAKAGERDAEGLTLLMLACMGWKEPCAKALIELGADIEAADGHGNTALLYAGGPCAMALVEAGANPNPISREAYDAHRSGMDSPLRMPTLFNAITMGDAALCKALIEAGADIEARMPSINAETPLMMACCSGDAAIVKLLLDAGADMAATSGLGETAKEMATQFAAFDGGACAAYLEVEELRRSLPQKPKQGASPRV